MLLRPLQQEGLIVHRLVHEATLQLKEERQYTLQYEGLGTQVAPVEEDRPDERLQRVAVDVTTALTHVAPYLQEAIEAHA